MERPSHSVFRSEHPFTNRLVSTGLALSVPLAIGLVLSHGLVGKLIGNNGPLVYVPDHTLIKHPLPPPPLHLPPMTRIVIPDPELPPINIDKTHTDDFGGGPAGGTKTVVQPLPPTGPTRALSGIAASHSQPPYPVIEERLGEEGTVSLRLTVTADGHVAKADIVTSSGHPRLDEAAQNWIVAHWLYRPALDNGQPVASQIIANVIFSLKTAP